MYNSIGTAVSLTSRSKLDIIFNVRVLLLNPFQNLYRMTGGERCDFYGWLRQPGMETFDILSTVSNFRYSLSKAFCPSISTPCVDPLFHPRIFHADTAVRKVSTHSRQNIDNRTRIDCFFFCRCHIELNSRALRAHLETLSISIGYYFVGSIADSILMSYHMYDSHLYCRQQRILQSSQAIRIDTTNSRHTNCRCQTTIRIEGV